MKASVIYLGLILSAVNMFAQETVFEQPIFFKNYAEYEQKVDEARGKLTPQETLDLGIVVQYLHVQRKSLEGLGLATADHDAFVVSLLNGCSPRKMILIVAGMMLSECAGDLGRTRAEGADAKESYQRRDYVNMIKSWGIGFVSTYRNPPPEDSQPNADKNGPAASSARSEPPK